MSEYELYQGKCPHCGAVGDIVELSAIGFSEVALSGFYDNGVEYADQTEINWNSIEPERDADGWVLYRCKTCNTDFPEKDLVLVDHAGCLHTPTWAERQPVQTVTDVVTLLRGLQPPRERPEVRVIAQAGNSGDPYVLLAPQGTLLDNGTICVLLQEWENLGRPHSGEVDADSPAIERFLSWLEREKGYVQLIAVDETLELVLDADEVAVSEETVTERAWALGYTGDHELRTSGDPAEDEVGMVQDAVATGQPLDEAIHEVVRTRKWREEGSNHAP